MGIKIGFWDNCLSERGTTVALYDYAYYNKHYLKNESIILYNSSIADTASEVVEKFKKEFPVYGVSSFSLVDDILVKTGCSILYIIKYGTVNEQLSRRIKTVVHAVFDATQPHGNVYASISDIVVGTNSRIPVVPHMINLPDVSGNFRKELGIPDTATVFGRYGGNEQFSIQYVKDAVYTAVRARPDVYFVFANTVQFCPPHPRIIHIDKIVDLNRKVQFINTCDAMLWARWEGETFGLAIGEFSSKNKPIFATVYNDRGLIPDKAHSQFLKDRAFWYDKATILPMLMSFDKTVESEKDWNMYREFEPTRVMDIFKRVFID